MINKIEDFAAAWTMEAELTCKVLDALTDASLAQRVSEGRRTLGQIAWHLVTSVHYVTTLGLEFDPPAGGKEAPDSAAFIAAEYRRISAAMLHAVKTQWTDHTLAETQMVFGEEWSNGGSLHFMMMHQSHHRGQMTVLMRQAGLRVPYIYGPAYEDWGEQGLEPRI